MGPRIAFSLRWIGACALMLACGMTAAQPSTKTELPKIEEIPIQASGRDDGESYRLSPDKLEKLRQLENQTPGRLFEFRSEPPLREANPNRPIESKRRRP